MGSFVDGSVILGKQGQLARAHWTQIPAHFTFVTLDVFTILPDHIHGILIFRLQKDAMVNSVSNENVISCSLSAVIRSFKSAVTKSINEYLQTPGKRFWQRNYYDRIIRDEDSLQQIRRYIENNVQMHWLKHIGRNPQS